MAENNFSRTIFRHAGAKRTFPLILALVIAGLLAIAWAIPLAHTRKAEASTQDAKAVATTFTSPQANSTQPGGEVMLLTLSRNGFEPAEITQSAGRFLLVFNNRSGVEELTLRLDRESGGRLKDIHARSKRSNWRGVVDLPRGRYLLTEDNHPDWVCRITITAR